MQCRAPTIYFRHFSPPTFLCYPSSNMASASPRPSSPPVGADPQTNENAIEADLVANMSSTLEEIQTELKPNNANEERGGPAKNMSNTLEQTPDNSIKPNDTKENPAVSIEGSLNKMSDTLEHVLEVLKGSTIAKERGKDDNSKFWATYKRVSTEYDNDFLEQADDDMGIILTFAGLFSAVNSTFLVGSQPNPGDTTNALLLYLIKVTVDGSNSVPDISTLSSFTGFVPSTVWMQSLSYASLAFSVLAAFGAVLGKQWLNSYKVVREGRTIEERGIERQVKLDGVEYFRLQVFLRMFLVLLQISLLLFGLSLSARIWVLQTTISSIIICVTAFGVLFYVGTVLVSVLRPDSPFQTPTSELLVTIYRKFRPDKTPFTFNLFGKSSAIRWILDISTNPDIIETAAAILPSVQWPRKHDASATFARLHDHFVACQDKELYIKFGKAMAHLCVQSVKIKEHFLKFHWNDEFEGMRSRFIRDAFMAGRAAYDKLKNSEKKEDEMKHRADTRTALRTLVVHGVDEQFSRPDDEHLIWNGDLRWRHSDDREPSCEEFDWLVDYLADDAEHDMDDETEGDAGHVKDNETEGDALLALSAMRGLGSSTKQQSYIKSLIHCMGPTRPPRVRHTALRAVFEAREELASLTSASASKGVDAQLLNELCQALSTAVHPNDHKTIHDAALDHYLHLLYVLTKNNEWYQRLTRNGHLDRCIPLVDAVSHERFSEVGFYLLVIFGRMKSSGKEVPFSPIKDKWRVLITNAWDNAQYLKEEDDYVDGIPAFVTATRLNLAASYNRVPTKWFTELASKVHQALIKWQKKQATLVAADDGVARAKVDAAISDVQGLYDELSRMIKQRDKSQEFREKSFGIEKDMQG